MSQNTQLPDITIGYNLVHEAFAKVKVLYEHHLPQATLGLCFLICSKAFNVSKSPNVKNRIDIQPIQFDLATCYACYLKVP
jgi:hypothetical protein